jgi:hypothetical protein
MLRLVVTSTGVGGSFVVDPGTHNLSSDLMASEADIQRVV